MKEKLSCPECDSTSIKTEKICEAVNVPFGKTGQYEKTFHVCENCGEKGSFSNKISEENHEKYYAALKETNKLSVADISQHLSAQGDSMAHIERSLGLAQRTLSRWKTQGVSASGMALMRIIRTYPWILNVADENFDEQFANKELVSQAAKVLTRCAQENNITIETQVIQSANKVTVIGDFHGPSNSEELQMETDQTSQLFKYDRVVPAGA
ncbi:MAG: hypothetical protein NPINA01_24990 [Nitrospinaceae bacterium]|nr:MAG: hypothetical protein NPINA01_24990 [Nitrospinaceae bacterium]